MISANPALSVPQPSRQDLLAVSVSSGVLPRIRTNSNVISEVKNGKSMSKSQHAEAEIITGLKQVEGSNKMKTQDWIPRRIVQMWAPAAGQEGPGRGSEQPLENRAAMLNLKLLNSDYEYLFFDGAGMEKFIDREFPRYRAVFDSFRFAVQRYDFFRYLAVYRYGGFYFDLDVLLAADLSGLLWHGCVFPFEALTSSHFLRAQHGMDWEVGNYAFGAAPGHPFLEAIIENCIRAQRDPSWVKPMMCRLPPLSRDEFYVLSTTGPWLVSRTLAENPDLARLVTVLFPDDVRDVRNWNCFGDVGIHLMSGAWRPKRNPLRRRLARYWAELRMRALMKESTRLGPTRSYGQPKDDPTPPERKRRQILG